MNNEQERSPGPNILARGCAIECFSSSARQIELLTLFATGTRYPTGPEAVRLWMRGAMNGQTGIRLNVCVVSSGKPVQRSQSCSAVSATELYILADPPVDLQRDAKRFLCSFQVDGHRRLLVTVFDNLSRKTLLNDHPVVRL